jgi:hypothetical protein
MTAVVVRLRWKANRGGGGGFGRPGWCVREGVSEWARQARWPGPVVRGRSDPVWSGSGQGCDGSCASARKAAAAVAGAPWMNEPTVGVWGRLGRQARAPFWPFRFAMGLGV